MDNAFIYDSSLRLSFLSRASFDNGVVSLGGILVTDGEAPGRAGASGSRQYFY
jgi:hypothetical protein